MYKQSGLQEWLAQQTGEGRIKKTRKKSRRATTRLSPLPSPSQPDKSAERFSRERSGLDNVPHEEVEEDAE